MRFEPGSGANLRQAGTVKISLPTALPDSKSGLIVSNNMKPPRKYYLLIPEKIEELISIWETNSPFKNFRVDNAVLLLSIICTHQRKDDNDNFYAQLKMEYLQNRVYNAEKYMRFFKEEGIVTTLGGYVVGEHSYRYQFKEPFYSRYIRKELHNQKLKRTVQTAIASEGRKMTRKYPHQKSLLRGMTIDLENAEKLIWECYGSGTSEKEICQYNYALGSVVRVANKEWIHTIEPTGGRLHTNLTNLPKVLRCETKINGERLSGIDIRNCEPYLANKILFNPTSGQQFFPGKFPLMKLKCLRLSEQQDVTHYRLLTSKAQFYKYLETEFNKRGCSYEVISELKVSKELKQKIFQIFFANNRYKFKERGIFNELFPGVDRAFTVLREQNHVHFNNLLTRMQSHIVLDVILEFINSEYPEMVALQIHDNITTSIATTDVEKASEVMNRELTSFVGVPPSLKVEKF